jgi:hypothetical protein
MAWQPPPRPLWVAELNAFGRQLGEPAALVPLDADELVATARSIAGLDDLGSDSWRAGFDVLLRSLADEADLNLVGRLMARNDIVRSLVNRLQIQAVRAQHPEIANERVDAPILVVGTGRSGTSLLHELLAQDVRHRVARTWELLHPCPPPEAATYRDDARIAAADQEYTFWHLVTPEYLTMHENGGDVPNEDLLIDMLEFASDQFMGAYPTPSYGRWLARTNLAPVFRAHRQFLQVLQWRAPGERWVLKCPSYLGKLPAFFAEYPDAYVVLTHRDPMKVLPSLVSIMATLQWMHTDDVDVGRIVKNAVHGTAIAMDMVMQWRTGGTIPDDRVIDVLYADLVASPVDTVQRVLERASSSLTPAADAAITDYLATRPRNRHGQHDYAFADTGLDLAETRERFADYQDRYKIPNEV